MASDSELWWDKYYQGNTKQYLDSLLNQNNPQGTKSLEINQRQVYDRLPIRLKWNEEEERSGNSYGGIVLDHFRPDQEHIINLTSTTAQIINDITSGFLQIPHTFYQATDWVKSGQISENDFLNQYHNLIERGLIHEAHAEPTPEPEPEPENILSVNAKISFTDTNIGGFSTSIPVNDAHQAMLLASKSSEWQWTLIGSSTNLPLTSLNDLLNTINDLLATPTPEPILEPTPEPDLSYITDNMITQKFNYFSIIDGRAKGEITFTINNNFNPYYFNKNIINYTSFITPNNITINVKQNTLRFTQTERNEIIQFDEDMKGNTRATIQSLVHGELGGAFSKVFSIEISATEPPKPISSGFMGAGMVGAIAGLVLLGFIADNKGGK